MKLKVTFKNGRYAEYCSNEYDSWYYDGSAIIIKLNGRLVSVYNMGNIIGVCEYEKNERI